MVYMKKSILIGSVIVTSILILMGFVSTVGATIVDTADFIKKIKDLVERNEWYPGYWILEIIVFILICFLKGIMPP